MLKIFAAFVLLGVGLAVFYFGQVALIAVVGVSLGLLLGEAFDFTSVRRAAVADADEEDENVGRARRGR